MEELAQAVGSGKRAVLLFVVGRERVQAVRPADEVDPAYGLALRAAIAAGVEVMAMGLRFGDSAITLDGAVPVRITPAPPAPVARPRGSGRA